MLVDEDADAMDHVESGSHKPYRTVINVNGTSLPMEIDMGALVSVIGKQTFESLQKGVSTLELQSTAVNLKTYTGESITVLGSVLVPEEYSGQTLNLPLIVTQEEGSPLLGRDCGYRHYAWTGRRSSLYRRCSLSSKYSTSTRGCSRRGWVNYRTPRRRSTSTQTNGHISFRHVRFPSPYTKRWRSWNGSSPWESSDLSSFQTGQPR